MHHIVPHLRCERPARKGEYTQRRNRRAMSQPGDGNGRHQGAPAPGAGSNQANVALTEGQAPHRQVATVAQPVPGARVRAAEDPYAVPPTYAVTGGRLLRVLALPTAGVSAP